MKINPHKTIATLALVLMTTAVTFATGTVSIPHTFSAGQTALANDVNENFQALANAINALSAKVTGQYDVTNSFTVTPTSVVAGDTVSISGTSYSIVTHAVVSFEDSNAAQYTVLAPLSSSGLAVTQSSPTYFNRVADKFQKTTISGYPTLVGLAFTNFETASSVSNTAECRVQIKLDSATYVMLTSEYAGTVSNPITKAQQTAAASMCRTLLNYVSITSTPAT